jgi:branched-chain amino acid transport system substrate-binding protein
VGQRSAIRIGVALVAASLAFAAGCGNRGGETDPGSQGGDEPTKTAKIGVIAPLTGDLAALGLGIKNGVDLAVKQANEEKAIPGWKLELAANDDAATPDVGKNAATKLAGDDEVVAVVGTLNSGVSQSVQPVLGAANILQVSPANTADSLSKGAKFADAPERPFKNYFRVCTVDSIQGPFAARYVFNELGIKEVATVHDKKTYGQGLVAAFTEEFKKLGGTIVAAETINPDEDNFEPVISKIKPKNPKLLYYGGEYPQSGPMTQQMKSQGLAIPLFGGDGMYSGDYIKLAGAAAPGNLATSVGAPTSELESAKKFVEDYEAAGYKEPYEAYGAYSYDAGKAIVEALKVGLKDATDAKSARQAVVDAMQSVSFDGVTGKVAFDEFGDTTTRVLTVYKVEGDTWASAFTEEFK